MKNYKCKKIKVGQTMQEVEKQIKGVKKKKEVKHKEWHVVYCTML